MRHEKFNEPLGPHDPQRVFAPVIRIELYLTCIILAMDDTLSEMTRRAWVLYQRIKVSLARVTADWRIVNLYRSNTNDDLWLGTISKGYASPR